VVHRDLKPENILYSDTSEDSPIKIADFGFAQRVRTAGLATDCGSPWYVAPEILTGIRYESSVDMWSIGVITYILLCGYPPFRDENQPRLFVKIREVQYDFDSPFWDDISQDAKNFVFKLLQGDPKNRLTAAQAQQHPWLTQTNTTTSGLRDVQSKLHELVALRGEV
jgi:calcium/calmodulin-dependent protein kinase I